VELLARWFSGASALCGGGGLPRGKDGKYTFHGLRLEGEESGRLQRGGVPLSPYPGLEMLGEQI
jgi:hypothetical protein